MTQRGCLKEADTRSSLAGNLRLTSLAVKRAVRGKKVRRERRHLEIGLTQALVCKIAAILRRTIARKKIAAQRKVSAQGRLVVPGRLAAKGNLMAW